MASESSFNARPCIQAFVATSAVLNPTRAPWILYINRSCAKSALHGVTCDTATWAAMSTSFPATLLPGPQRAPVSGHCLDPKWPRDSSHSHITSRPTTPSTPTRIPTPPGISSASTTTHTTTPVATIGSTSSLPGSMKSNPGTNSADAITR